MVDAGIRSILNFAPAMIAPAPGVSVRKVDLAVELQILAFYEQRKATLAEVKKRGRAVAELGGPLAPVPRYFAIEIQSAARTARIMTPSRMNCTLP